MAKQLTRIRNLSIWQGTPKIAPLTGGLTNLNYRVTDQSGEYVVRLGADIPVHHVMRFNELAASRAAHAAGISPAVVHAEDGLTVIEFISARTLQESDLRVPEMLEKTLTLLHKCHHDVPKHLRGPVLMFWVFHVLRDYAATLIERDSNHGPAIPEYLDFATRLEDAVGPVEIVFGHNDLLAANILDDGDRLWLIDWDYAGFNSPLFDLGGLASNNGLDGPAERGMLERYFQTPLTDILFHRYHAMKCASLLRETMWSMISELTSTLDVDYGAYTAENLTRFRCAYADFVNT